MANKVARNNLVLYNKIYGRASVRPISPNGRLLKLPIFSPAATRQTRITKQKSSPTINRKRYMTTEAA